MGFVKELLTECMVALIASGSPIQGSAKPRPNRRLAYIHDALRDVQYPCVYIYIPVSPAAKQLPSEPPHFCSLTRHGVHNQMCHPVSLAAWPRCLASLPQPITIRALQYENTKVADTKGE